MSEIDNKKLGSIGENLALCRYVDKGCRLVAANWRAGKMAELDLVVFDDSIDTLIICEVKTRSVNKNHDDMDSAFIPSDSVGPRKQMKNIYGAKLFLQKHPEFAEKNVRFDVAQVYNISGAYEVSIIEEAF